MAADRHRATTRAVGPGARGGAGGLSLTAARPARPRRRRPRSPAARRAGAARAGRRCGRPTARGAGRAPCQRAPQRAASVGPNSSTDGVPSAVARWRDAGVAADDAAGGADHAPPARAGPVRPASTASSGSPRRAATASGESRSSGPPVIDDVPAAARSARATAAKRSAGQRRAGLAAPGCTTVAPRPRAARTGRAARAGRRRARVGRDPGLAPAAGTSARTSCSSARQRARRRLGHVGVGEGDQPPRAGGQRDAVRLRAACRAG